jgi:hypothetical protein
MLFWDLMQCRLVVYYPHFRTAYRSQFQGTHSKDFMTLEEGIDRFSRNISNSNILEESRVLFTRRREAEI